MNYLSKRALKQPSEVMALLKDYKAWQAQERLKSGDMWKDVIGFKILSGSGYSIKEAVNDRIFTTSDGNLICPDTINFWLERFLEKKNLPIVTPHSLRHTNITLQIAAGVSLRTISARAGHSLTSTTRLVENVYCGKCGETTIVEYTINDDKFGIILNGKCKQCGESVVRLIED